MNLALTRFGLPLALVLTAIVSRPAVAEDRALIIGVDRYPNLPEREQLTASVNDARLMAQLATEVWGFAPGQIKMLTDEDATSTNILSSIRSWLIAGTNPGDRVLISYSGHGYYTVDQNADESDGWDETLAPSDARLGRGGYENMIVDDQIGALLNMMADRNIEVVVDSCHSGTITRALDPGRRSGESIVRSPSFGSVSRGLSDTSFGLLRRDKAFIDAGSNMSVWTAVSASQLAQEDASEPPDTRNGVFTRAFVDGLISHRADANQNGQISEVELLAYVRTRAIEYCRQFTCETGMTPTLEAPARMLASNLLAWGEGAVASSGAAETDVSVNVEDGAHQAQPPASNGSDSGDEGEQGAQDGQLAATDVLTNGDVVGAKVDILPRSDVALGQAIQIKVTSPKPGFVILLDLRDNGDVYQLFPSICTPPERAVRANAPLTLPDETYGCTFKANRPGSGRILAIITEDNVPLEDLLAEHRDLEIIPDSMAFLTALVQRLLAIWTGDERNRVVHWSVASAEYTIGS